MKRTSIVIALVVSAIVGMAYGQSRSPRAHAAPDLAVSIEERVAAIEARIERLERTVVAFMKKNPVLRQNVVVAPQNLAGSAKVIEPQIEDDFEGWDGETVFKLDNGQIWQQASYDYKYHYAYRPKVLIFKKDSRWYMKVDGIEKTIEVEQLK